MNHASHRYGFGLSTLLHLGLALAVLWGWQQRSEETALPGEPLPLTLSLFVEAPPLPVPQRPPEAVLEVPPEAVVEPEALQPPEPPKPLERAASTNPRPTVAEAPVEPVRPEPPVHKAPADPAPGAEPVAQARVPPPAVAPTPQSATDAAARTRRIAALRARYKAALLAAIERHKFYPKRARRRGIEGEVLVSFTIEADGRLSDIRVAQGSGSRLLDEAALSALRRLSRVDALPEELAMSRWELTVPMLFEIH